MASSNVKPVSIKRNQRRGTTHAPLFGRTRRNNLVMTQVPIPLPEGIDLESGASIFYALPIGMTISWDYLARHQTHESQDNVNFYYIPREVIAAAMELAHQESIPFLKHGQHRVIPNSVAGNKDKVELLLAANKHFVECGLRDQSDWETKEYDQQHINVCWILAKNAAKILWNVFSDCLGITMEESMKRFQHYKEESEDNTA